MRPIAATDPRGPISYGWHISEDEMRRVLTYKRPSYTNSRADTGCNLCRESEKLSESVHLTIEEMDDVDLWIDRPNGDKDRHSVNIYCCPDCVERLCATPVPRARWHRAERIIEL